MGTSIKALGEIPPHLGFEHLGQAASFMKMVSKHDDYQVVELVPPESLGKKGPDRVVFCYAVLAKELTEDIRTKNRLLQEQVYELKKELKHVRTEMAKVYADLAKAKASLNEARRHLPDQSE